MAAPPSGPPADGFGFYLKPAAAAVDTVNNQVGGYTQGLGVEFITYGTPRHQIVVNGVALPGSYNLSPVLDGVFHPVIVDFRRTPGQSTSFLTVNVDGRDLLKNIPVNYTPADTDVFAFAARTGGFAQTTALDNLIIQPTTKKPASNLTTRILSQPSGLLVSEVKWDTEPGGIYDVYLSTDLTNWAYSRSYTATAATQAFSSITQPSTQPRFFYRVARQQ